MRRAGGLRPFKLGCGAARKHLPCRQLERDGLTFPSAVMAGMEMERLGKHDTDLAAPKYAPKTRLVGLADILSRDGSTTDPGPGTFEAPAPPINHQPMSDLPRYGRDR